MSASVSGRTPPQIGEHNLRVILEAIRRDGPLTRHELGRLSGLSAPGVANVLRRLADGALIVAGKRSAGGGRAATEYAISPEGAFGIGIRLGGSWSEAVLVDLGGGVRERHRFPAGADVAACAVAMARRWAANLGSDGRLLGIGVAGPEPESLPLAAMRAALAPLEVLGESDSVAALLAERTLGAGIVEGGTMLIVLDDSVRAGLLLRGVPFGGVHGRAGSIGAMRTGPDRLPLDCAAGLGRLRAVMSDAERAALAAGDDLPLSPAIGGWMDEAASHLLDAITATAGFLAPGIVIIGGALPHAMTTELIGRMSLAHSDAAVRPFKAPWLSPIRASSFPGAGIALGAALLPFFSTLLPPPTASG